MIPTGKHAEPFLKSVIPLFLSLLISTFCFSQNIVNRKTAAALKPLGLIGGTSWHSTLEYYSYINQAVNDTFGNNTNPPLLLINLDQHHIHELQRAGRWDSIALILTDACDRLQKAGAAGIIFCANTPHKVYEEVQRKTVLPILHIADATGKAIVRQKLRKVGFIGTLFSMEEPFITQRLKDQFKIDVIVPDKETDRQRLHTIIQEELSLGILKSGSKFFILDQIRLLKERGAEGIVLGCTEFPLIIKPEDVDIPVFNTTLLHAAAGVDFILGR